MREEGRSYLMFMLEVLLRRRMRDLGRGVVAAIYGCDGWCCELW